MVFPSILVYCPSKSNKRVLQKKERKDYISDWDHIAEEVRNNLIEK